MSNNFYNKLQFPGSIKAIDIKKPGPIYVKSFKKLNLKVSLSYLFCYSSSYMIKKKNYYYFIFNFFNKLIIY